MDLLVDRYRHVRSLGRGAMGEVWLAEDTRLGRPVAIKQLRADAVGDDGQLPERMRREARLAAQLNHPNAVAVYDLIIEHSQPYVVMEYVPGHSLAAHIQAAGRLSPAEAGHWIGQVAAALEAAHGKGIVHRDVKPANILITPEGSAKLADFGIARSVQDVNRTSTGLMVGTPAYLAPEVARGGEPSPATDIWSLGATLYAAVEGSPPFGSAGDNPLGLVLRIGTEAPPAPRFAGPLTSILGGMMQRDPMSRPSAGQVRSWLVAQSRATSPPPPPSALSQQPRWIPPSQSQHPPRTRRSPALIVGVAAAVVLLGVAAVLVAVQLGSGKPTADPSTSAPVTRSSSPDFPSTSAQTPTSPPPTTPTTPTRPTTTAPPVYPKPSDVPVLPATDTAVPVNATPPSQPANPAVRAYTTPDPTPSTRAQLVEWQPPGLKGDDAAAITSVVGFLLAINRQDFGPAWHNSTEGRHGAKPSSVFTSGYASSRHYQLAFGQPRRLEADLIAVPARFVSRQNPAAQGSPSGVTNCTYWPQYVFLVANVNGRWLDDVAADYTARASVAGLKRFDSVRNNVQLEPLSQRVAC